MESRSVSHTPDCGVSFRDASIRMRRAMREFEETQPDIAEATKPEVMMVMGSLTPTLTFMVEGKRHCLHLDRAFLKKLKRDYEFLDALRRASAENIRRNPEAGASA